MISYQPCHGGQWKFGPCKSTVRNKTTLSDLPGKLKMLLCRDKGINAVNSIVSVPYNHQILKTLTHNFTCTISHYIHIFKYLIWIWHCHIHTIVWIIILSLSDKLNIIKALSIYLQILFCIQQLRITMINWKKKNGSLCLFFQLLIIKGMSAHQVDNISLSLRGLLMLGNKKKDRIITKIKNHRNGQRG